MIVNYYIETEDRDALEKKLGDAGIYFYDATWCDPLTLSDVEQRRFPHLDNIKAELEMK